MFGVAIVGTGVISAEHARSAAALSRRARLIAVADVDEHRLRHAAGKHFVPFCYTDHRRLLDRADVDLVVVATPPATHQAIVEDSLQAGKFVLCEKPLAHTLAAADRIIDASTRFPSRLTTGYQLRFARDLRRILWLRDHGRLGRLTGGEIARWESLADVPHLGEGWWGKWGVAGGGSVMTQFIHQLDLLIQVFGAVNCVSAAIDTRYASIESEDSFEAEITFQNGARVRCAGGVHDQPRQDRVQVRGERGTVCLPWQLRMRDERDTDEAEAQLEHVFPSPRSPGKSLAVRAVRKVRRKLKLGGGNANGRPPKPNLHADYYRALFDAIEAAEPLPVPPEDARRSLELCVAIYTSGITGQDVTLPLDVDSPFYEGVTPADYARRAKSVKMGDGSRIPVDSGWKEHHVL